MAEKKILVDINLNQNELRNAVIENEATTPSVSKEGQIYYDSNAGTKRIKMYNGSAWKKIATEDDIASVEGKVTDVKVNGSSVVSNKVANITVPTKISDLTDDTATNPIAKAGTLTGLTATVSELNYTDGVTSNIQTQLNNKQATISDLSTIRSNAQSGANAAATIAGYGDIVTHDTSEFATAAQGAKADTALQPEDVINDVVHTDTDKPLSANMGKELSDRIANIANIGKYLANWNATTGLPTTNPSTSLPYAYTTGMYYVVSVVGSTNYKPSGSSYTGDASTTVESGTLDVGDFYIYDGTNWNLLKNTGVTTTFGNVGGDPYDNTNLASALNTKAPLASPTLTGTPKAPTAAVGTNTTQIATTAFVQSTVSANGNVFTASNPALTSSSGECTWTISTTSGKRGIVLAVLDSTNDVVYPGIKSAVGTLTIKFNSSSNIAASSYTAIYLEK